MDEKTKWMSFATIVLFSNLSLFHKASQGVLSRYLTLPALKLQKYVKNRFKSNRFEKAATYLLRPWHVFSNC